MSRMSEDGTTAHGSALSARGGSADARRANARLGRLPKTSTPVLAMKSTRRSAPAITRRHRKALHAGRDPGPPERENVESLAMYRPYSRNYEVSLTFSGQAGAVMSELMTHLGVDTPNEVVKRAIPLLLSARGKEILLRDPKTGAIEIVET